MVDRKANEDAAKVIVTVDLSELPEFRLLLWTLREILGEMRDNRDYKYAERLGKAIERFVDETYE